MSEKIVTIQKTSKKYKAAGCLGGLLIISGVIGFGVSGAINETNGTHSAPVVPVILIILGLVSYLYGRIGKWWNND